MSDKEKLSLAMEALEEICWPIKYMRVRAESEGATLDGLYANMLAKDPHYLQKIASDAINKIQQQ